VTDGRHRITAFKELGFTSVKAYVDGDKPTAAAKPKPEPVKAKLKAEKWNPDAIPNLTTEAFGEYLLIRRQLIAQDDPENIWNQTQKESGLRTVQYRSAVSNAVKDGFIPSDAAIADAKLTKTELKQLESNRRLQEQWKQQAKQIDNALNHPIADDKANKTWKARMTEEEANLYTQDTFFGSMNWYHSNVKEVTQSIATEGAMPDRNRRGMYGRGVYFGIDKTIGEDYAAAAPYEVEMLTTQVRSKNPFITTREELNQLREKLTEYNDTEEEDSVNLSRYIQARGYDSIYMKNLGYGIVFDTKQVVTIQQEDMTERKEEFAQNMQQRSSMQVGLIPGDGTPWKKNPNARALAELDSISTER